MAACTDLVVVGAGPAGLGAAITARAAGLSVTVVDDQLAPGGQIWRGAAEADPAHALILGHEYAQGAERVRCFHESGADYLPEHVVWHIEDDAEEMIVHSAGPDGLHCVRAKRLLLATGAVERPFPVPGWTLPGVMSVGGLQILLKTARLGSDRTVLAGSGPLLWLLAAQLVDAGLPPQRIVECVSPSAYFRAATRLPGALYGPGPLKKGLSLIAKVQKAHVPVSRNAHDLRVEGDGRVQALSFRDFAGRECRVETDLVGLHSGVIPNQQATRLLRLPHSWNPKQHAFLATRDEELRAGPRLWIAGDGARIGGAEVAWLEGLLVGETLAGRAADEIKRKLARATASRPLLDTLYRTPPQVLRPTDETMLCRCEGVTAGHVRHAVRNGAMGPNQVKFMLRSGMGPCQGRVCGPAVSEVVAQTLGKTMDEVGYFRVRPPLKPVSLGLLARKDQAEDTSDAAGAETAAREPAEKERCV